LMPPIGWSWALFVWGYALVWFLINDQVKLLAYRILPASKPPAILAARSGQLPPARPPAEQKLALS
jgi:H+-transporting ATPase